MEDIKISKLEFMNFLTQGYPLELNKLEEEEFYSAFTYYVNSDENNFVAELVGDGVLIHAGMRTEICKLKYDGEKLLILTSFNEQSEDYSPEFTDSECRMILARACQGIIMFSKTYAIATGKVGELKDEKNIDKYIGDNSKYKPWPVRGA